MDHKYSGKWARWGTDLLEYIPPNFMTETDQKEHNEWLADLPDVFSGRIPRSWKIWNVKSSAADVPYGNNTSVAKSSDNWWA